MAARPVFDTSGRDGVSAIQRGRMLSGMVAEVYEHGVAGVTVAHVVARSGVSRRTFYEAFQDRDDCLLAAFDDGLERIAHVVVPAYERPTRWRERVRAGLIASLSFFEREPALARLLVVESLGAGPSMLHRRLNVIARLVQAVDGGREEAKGESGLPGITAEGLVGAVLSIVHGRLLAKLPSLTTPGLRNGNQSVASLPDDSLVELVNPLMSMIVLPYLGVAASRRELSRPVPKLGEANTASRANPLHGLGMRLTYRTVRVLIAVAANSGSSNRELAGTAGISDQGQISKLLTRLQGLGLVENAGADRAPGAPNAWVLTEKGWEVHGVIDTQATLS